MPLAAAFSDGILCGNKRQGIYRSSAPYAQLHPIKLLPVALHSAKNKIWQQEHKLLKVDRLLNIYPFLLTCTLPPSHGK